MSTEYIDNLLDQRTDEAVRSLPNPVCYVWVTNVAVEESAKIVVEVEQRFSCKVRLGFAGTPDDRVIPTAMLTSPPCTERIIGVFVPVRNWIRWWLRANAHFYGSINSPNISAEACEVLKRNTGEGLITR